MQSDSSCAGILHDSNEQLERAAADWVVHWPSTSHPRPRGG